VAVPVVVAEVVVLEDGVADVALAGFAAAAAALLAFIHEYLPPIPAA
jgi:hypothetical protein